MVGLQYALTDTLCLKIIQFSSKIYFSKKTTLSLQYGQEKLIEFMINIMFKPNISIRTFSKLLGFALISGETAGLAKFSNRPC